MFIHDTHLPQVLTPWHYTSQEQHDREIERLFMPAWHLIGTTAELSRDGDFLTDELFGYPLIVWRDGGEYHTFLNVCPHRFSRLSGKKCGNSPERLQCQYHGWEFDCGGNTRKIPDARSFRPMTQGALALTKFRTETCGQLIFVNLSADSPSLEEFLGPGYDIALGMFDAERRTCAKFDYELDANWKLKVENGLESYHVEMVHASTFQTVPSAEQVQHELNPRWTSYATVDEPPSRWLKFLDRLSHRIAGRPIDSEYKQHHWYPHIFFGKMRLYSWAENFIPISPTRARVIGRFFCYRGTPPSWRKRIFDHFLADWGRRFFDKVGSEDAWIIQELQKGLESRSQPSEGVVSIREERCFHFQDYIARETSDPNDADASHSTNGERMPIALGH